MHRFIVLEASVLLYVYLVELVESTFEEPQSYEYTRKEEVEKETPRLRRGIIFLSSAPGFQGPRLATATGAGAGGW